MCIQTSLPSWRLTCRRIIGGWTVSGDSIKPKLAMQAFQMDMEGVRSVLGEPQEVIVATVPGCDSLVDWMDVFRITQASPALQVTLSRFAELTGVRTCLDLPLNGVLQGESQSSSSNCPLCLRGNMTHIQAGSCAEDAHKELLGPNAHVQAVCSVKRHKPMLRAAQSDAPGISIVGIEVFRPSHTHASIFMPLGGIY